MAIDYFGGIIYILYALSVLSVGVNQRSSLYELYVCRLIRRVREHTRTALADCINCR